MLNEQDLLWPQWPAPENIRAMMSRRLGGVSQGPYSSLNLRPATFADRTDQGLVRDELRAIAQNQQLYAQALQARPVYLHQVHGAEVVQLHEHTPDFLRADAAVSVEVGVAPTVLVADCLPVLFCTADGHVVGAAHAGWRGLASGVLENTVSAIRGLSRQIDTEIYAWLGPCIGPSAFEVGEDVLQAFGVDPGAATKSEFNSELCFRAVEKSNGPQRWLANLPLLARHRLRQQGVLHIAGGHWCTYSDAEHFFSYRREPITGRMAASVCKKSNNLSQKNDAKKGLL